MSRRPHEPTAETRQTVSVHATVGTPQETIAQIIGIDATTLRIHYRDELDLAMAKANAVIGGSLFNKAKGGDTAAQIFWMKTRAGWREVIRHENDDAAVSCNINIMTAAPVGPIRVTRSDT